MLLGSPTVPPAHTAPLPKQLPACKSANALLKAVARLKQVLAILMCIGNNYWQYRTDYWQCVRSDLNWESPSVHGQDFKTKLCIPDARFGLAQLEPICKSDKRKTCGNLGLLGLSSQAGTVETNPKKKKLPAPSSRQFLRDCPKLALRCQMWRSAHFAQ